MASGHESMYPPYTLGGSRRVLVLVSLTLASFLWRPYLLKEVRTRVEQKMRRCGQWGGLTVCLEGFLCHPPPLLRGGPLSWHLTAQGGLTSHPLPCACVPTSEQFDTGAAVSAIRKWWLQSGRILSPPRATATPERVGGP